MTHSILNICNIFTAISLVWSNANFTNYTINICNVFTAIFLVQIHANLTNFTFNICIIFSAFFSSIKCTHYNQLFFIFAVIQCNFGNTVCLFVLVDAPQGGKWGFLGLKAWNSASRSRAWHLVMPPSQVKPEEQT